MCLNEDLVQKEGLVLLKYAANCWRVLVYMVLVLLLVTMVVVLIKTYLDFLV